MHSIKSSRTKLGITILTLSEDFLEEQEYFNFFDKSLKHASCHYLKALLQVLYAS